MNQPRLLSIVMVFMGVATSAAVFIGSAFAQTPSPANAIGPWFVSARPYVRPDPNKLRQVAETAVRECPGHAVSCEGMSSGGDELVKGNPRYAQWRQDACLEAVTAAGGTATSSGMHSQGVAGPHGRGVELSCATIPVRELLLSLPPPQQPVTHEQLPREVAPLIQASALRHIEEEDKFRLVLGGCMDILPENHGVDETSAIGGLLMGFQFQNGNWWGKLNGCAALGPDSSINALGSAVIAYDALTWLQLGGGPTLRGMYVEHLRIPHAWAAGVEGDLTFQLFDDRVDVTLAPGWVRWVDNAAILTGSGGELGVRVNYGW